MFGLIVGVSAEDKTIWAERLFESTEPSLRAAFEADLAKLTHIPTLVMPEITDETRPQKAQVGRIEAVFQSGRDLRYRFVPDPEIPAFPSSVIQSLATVLHINDDKWGEFYRTHWAIKEADLYHALLSHLGANTGSSSKVFTIPDKALTPKLVSFMMPFDRAFDAVHDALKAAVTDHGWQAKRADDIFDNRAIIQDIVELIATSHVVICDLSSKNPNVFYEAGIAHTLGREVVLLAQHRSDVPFDLGHLRYIPYVNNEQGLNELAVTLLRVLDSIDSRTSQ